MSNSNEKYFLRTSYIANSWQHPFFLPIHLCFTEIIFKRQQLKNKCTNIYNATIVKIKRYTIYIFHWYYIVYFIKKNSDLN